MWILETTPRPPISRTFFYLFDNVDFTAPFKYSIANRNVAHICLTNKKRSSHIRVNCTQLTIPYPLFKVDASWNSISFKTLSHYLLRQQDPSNEHIFS